MRSGVERLVTLVRRGGDLLAVALALGAAFWFRFGSGWVVHAHPEPDVLQAHLLSPLPIALLLSGVGFQLASLYSRRAPRSFLGEAWLVLRGTVLLLLLLLAATFLYRGESYSRIMAGTFAGVLPGFLLGVRRLIDAVEAGLRRRGIGLRRVLLVGGGEPLRSLADRLADDPSLGLEVVGRVGVGEVAGPATPDSEGQAAPSLPPLLGAADALAALVSEHEIDEVYLALPHGHQDRLRELDRALTGVPVDVRLVPDLAGCALIRPEVSTLADLPVITLRQGPHVGLNALVKRGFDLAVSAVLILLSAPLLLLIALAVKLTSPGAILYRQERVSWGGRQFTILKFRTMCLDADKIGPARTQRDDPRRTPLGTFLRRTSLDELPQLWNVLRGDMSLVGPRPEPLLNYPEVELQLPHFMLRHAVRAGMTGWAQVNGLRGDARLDERLRFDLDYIRRWSLGFDLKILVLTLVRGFVHPNAF